VVTLATLPLVAFYFNQFPWLGTISNLIAVPAMGLIIVPIGLAAGIWQLIEGGAQLPLASLPQRSIETFIQGLSLLAEVPGGEWHVASPSVPSVFLFYGCLGLLWLKSVPDVLRRSSLIFASALVIWWGWSPRLALDGNRFRVTFLDVAQGDSAVLELPDGKVVLIDGGATYERFDMGRGVVAPYLWNRGIRSIDHIIATHPQLDHVGGLAWILKHFSVGHYWGTGDVRDEPFYRRLQQALAQRGLSEQIAKAGQEVLISDRCRLSIENPQGITVGPEPPRRGKEGQGLNNRSVVARLTCGVHTMLFPADVERDALARMQARHPEPVEVLKVPHHGGVSSLNHEWIAALQPRYAVISVGRHNPYGHPTPAVLAAYEAQGVPVFRTDRDGGVWVVGSRPEVPLQIHTTRGQRILPTDLSSVWTSEKANWARLWLQWRTRM
jgi:competence protein ComEC